MYQKVKTYKQKFANSELSTDAFLTLCSIFYALDVNTNKIIPVKFSIYSLILEFSRRIK